MTCLYRRPSGVYVVRMAVPLRLRSLAGKREVHVSTGTSDWETAKLVALKVQLQWRERFMALDLEKLSAPSPLLAGGGRISIAEAASAIGLSVEALLGELRNRKVQLAVYARHWDGWTVDDFHSIERDDDGTFVWNDMVKKGSRAPISRWVHPFDSATSVASLCAARHSVEYIFRLGGTKAFWPATEIKLSLAEWFVSKSDVEAVRTMLSAAIPAPSLPLPPPTPTIVATPAVGGHPADKHATKKFSELYALYKGHKDWSEDHERRMATEMGYFIELLDDPLLGTVEHQTIQRYAELLSQLPEDTYLAQRKYKVTGLKELIAIAEREKLPRKKPKTVNRHVGKISEVLGFAHKQGLVHINPAAGYKRARHHALPAHQQRDAFTEKELALIFSQDWFRQGKGSDAHWRPHYYWLPLLALLSGGRLNELSQLYLDDIRESNGVAYLDFNLDGQDKIECDESDGVRGMDKSLKTANSIRVVPLHDIAIKAGLLEYVEELRKAGYNRLFPELKHNRAKGYGKA